MPTIVADPTPTPGLTAPSFDELLTLSRANVHGLELVARDSIPEFVGEFIALGPSADLVAGATYDELNGWQLHLHSLRDDSSFYAAGFPAPPNAPLRGEFSAVGNAFLVYDPVGNVVSVWNSSSPSTLHVVQSPVYGVGAASLHPGGRLLAIGGLHDGYLEIWNLTTWEGGKNFEGPPRQTMSLAFSPDGRYLAAGSDFGDIRVWNYSLGTLILDAHAGEDWVTAAAFDDNNRHIALGMGGFFHDTSVQIWELESGFRQWSLLEHSGGVKYLAFSPDGKLLASSDDSGELIIWDAGSGAALKKLSLPAPAIAGLRFSRDGKILQLGAEDGEILSYGVVAEKLK